MLSLWEQMVPSLGWGGHLEEDPEIELPLHLPWELQASGPWRNPMYLPKCHRRVRLFPAGSSWSSGALF